VAGAHIRRNMAATFFINE